MALSTHFTVRIRHCMPCFHFLVPNSIVGKRVVAWQVDEIRLSVYTGRMCASGNPVHIRLADRPTHPVVCQCNPTEMVSVATGRLRVTASSTRCRTSIVGARQHFQGISGRHPLVGRAAAFRSLSSRRNANLWKSVTLCHTHELGYLGSVACVKPRERESLHNHLWR
jgi:hypothetical protein